MRNTTKLLSLTLFICAIVIGACQKSDIPLDPESESFTDRFFNVPENGLPEVKNIATAIKKQNAAKPFVAGLAKRVGFPNWEKVLVAGNINASLARLSSGSEGYAVYIPFVGDSQSFVNSALVVTIKNSDTTYKMLYANRYASYGFDSTKKTGWNAWDVFNCFSLLNNLVFGHTKFLIKDSRLFAPVKPAKHVVLTMIKKSTDGTPNGKTAMYVDVCTTYERCDRYESEPTPPSNVIRTTSLAGCLETSTWVECTTYYINDSGGGGGSTGTDPGTGSDPTGGGGGTGGDDGSWADDPCSGGSTPSVQRTTNVLPCDEPIGWEPIDSSSEPTYLSKLDFLSEALNLSTIQKDWLFNKPQLGDQLYNYLQFSASLEKNEIGKEHLNTMMSNVDYFTFVSNHINSPGAVITNVWWEDNYWISDASNISFDIDAFGRSAYNPNDAEKALLKTYPIKGALIFLNKLVAENFTTSYMGINGLNDKSDAFRHCFFLTINSQDPLIGSAVTKLFSDAHETSTPQGKELEKQMDLFNNSVGIEYGKTVPFTTSFATIANEIKSNMIPRGDLKYLTPLDSYNQIIPGITQLTNSNQ